MDAIKAATIPSMRLSVRRGSPTTSSSPLAEPTLGSLHLTPHHVVFERALDEKDGAEAATEKQVEGEERKYAAGGAGEEDEVWIPLPLLHSVTRTPPSLTGTPSPLVLRTRDYTTYSLHFTTSDEADTVWDSLKGLCGSFSTGGLEGRYAFVEGGKEKGKGREGWSIYSPVEEFARMGVGSRSKAWRFTTINADFQFCPSYPAQLVVPAKISDNTLTYAVRYRSKSRIPGLVYLHWANLGSITRSSQPMVGLTQTARSIQDEKLVEAIFSSHSQHSHSLQPMTVSDRPISPSSASFDGGVVYGASANNIIIDARPSKNAYANSVKGAGTENMSYYKNCRKEYLGIDNIHVMRSSLSGVFDALTDAEMNGRLDRSALRRTGWLSHLTNILDGVLIIIRTVHLNNSHALVHCSDGWDRTSQLSALPQLCLDPFFRTARGLAVLIEKDWISYGHRFADRSGHLCNDRVDFVQKLGDDATTQQAFLASVQRQFAPSSHAFKETCPVFQQFLDCIYQIQRQFPDRFEWNEELLRHLVRETYAGTNGSFLFNSEKERADLGARQRTSSVWETVFDSSEPADPSSSSKPTLTLKPHFRNAAYNPSLDDPQSKSPTADQGVLLFNPQDVRWWHELFGRSDEEMNGGDLPGAPTVTEHKVVQSEEDDPVLHPLTAQTAQLNVSAPVSPGVSPSRGLAAPPAPLSASSRSSSPSAPLASHPHPHSPASPPPQLAEGIASVQKLGWSAWKSVRKFGEDAARQYKEAQAAAAAKAQADAEAAARGGGGGAPYAHEAEASTGSWRAMGRSEDGANELGTVRPPPPPPPALNAAAGGAGIGSLGRSAGSMWSKLSASNPWAAGEGGSSSFAASAAPAPAADLAYKPYQPRTAHQSRLDNSVGSLSSSHTASNGSAPTSPSSSLYSSAQLPSASSSNPPPALRQPSSTLSVNPWESISREEAIIPSPSTTSSAPPPTQPLQTAHEPPKAPKSDATDPLGVGFA
ncbi:hypothetical protein JCM8097_006961 [Rhodosporidiobolus ruineniae]